MMNPIIFSRKVFDYFYSHLIQRNKYWLWYYLCAIRSKKIKEKLLCVYKEKRSCPKEPFQGVVCLYEGNVYQGGLADRLRGILSVYKTCKDRGIDFKLHFKHPFDLEWYLQPNQYDWRMLEENIECDTNKVELLVLDATSDDAYSRKKQERWLYNHICMKTKQYHCYTNVCYSYDYDYSVLFSELFALTPRLEHSIEALKQSINQLYISVSARFLDLLGDFNESFGYGMPLPDEQKERLISANLKQIEEFHRQYPHYKILVNSDSITFTERAQAFPYVFVNPGSITHIDNTRDKGYEAFEKTFLDFFMIANAERIYLLKTGRMYKSGYPYAASLINGKPFKVINF